MKESSKITARLESTENSRDILVVFVNTRSTYTIIMDTATQHIKQLLLCNMVIYNLQCSWTAIYSIDTQYCYKGSK